MNKIHPDSPKAISEYSLWHMTISRVPKRLGHILRDDASDAVQSVLQLLVFIFHVFILLCPPIWLIIGYIWRKERRKDMKRWGEQTREVQAKVMKVIKT